jgi:hypothetical protein
MSGGSYDYSYGKVQEMAGQLISSDDPLRVAFANHLRLVAQAMHDVEWVDSGDSAKGSDAEAIQAVLGDSAHRAELPVILDKAEQLVARFERAIDRAGPQPNTIGREEVMALRNAAHTAMNKLDGANERGDIATRLAAAYSNVLSILGAPGEGADIEELSEWAREYGAKLEALTREVILWRNRTASLVWKLPPETTAGEVQKWGTEYQTELAKAEARVAETLAPFMDGTPITSEWLQEQGFKLVPSNMGPRHAAHHELGRLNIWEYNGTGQWILRDSDDIEVSTRGQLRCLATLFGVALADGSTSMKPT